MNFYGAWTQSWSRLALDIVAPSPEAYRPAGAAVLKAAFGSFGLAPLPYRVLCVLLLGLNIGLHFFLVRALTLSTIAAGFSSFLFSAHACMSDLYLSTATIYDLLAFAFVHAGILVYIVPRLRGDGVSWKRWAAIAACALLASGAKEVGLVLPVMLLGYEIFFQAGATRKMAGPALLTALTALRFAAPLLAANPRMLSNPAYALHLDSSSVSQMVVSYTRMLLLDMGVQPASAYALVGAIALLAFVWRSPAFRFGTLLFVCAAAPLMLIAPRSLYVLYIAYSGWCMLWATALSRIPLPPAVTLASVAMVFGTMNLRAWPHTVSWAPAEQAKVQCALEAARPLVPHLTHDSRILVTDDPFPSDDSMLTFAFRLQSGHKELAVWRLRAHPQAAEWTDPWSLKVRIEGCKAVQEHPGPI